QSGKSLPHYVFRVGRKIVWNNRGVKFVGLLLSSSDGFAKAGKGRLRREVAISEAKPDADGLTPREVQLIVGRGLGSALRGGHSLFNPRHDIVVDAIFLAERTFP